jgi:tripartite-type tricarboxylate transporter receptor subunit TctC
MIKVIGIALDGRLKYGQAVRFSAHERQIAQLDNPADGVLNWVLVVSLNKGSFHMPRLWQALFASVFAFSCGAVSAVAQPADTEFFRGKTVTYIVSVGPGGGYDIYGRLLARYLGKHLPGARFLVRNVPGAGHIVGANTIYTARPDGLTIGTFVTGLIYTQLLERQGVRFDLARMSWVGRMADEARGLVISKRSGLTSVEDLINADTPLLLSTAGVGASNHIESLMLAYALGLNVRLVPNMLNPEAQMSMVRGEVVGVLGSESSFDAFVEQGNGTFMLSIATGRSAIDGVPRASDYIVRDDARPLFEFIETMTELGRLTAGPPDIPPARLAALRQAFNAAVADPDLRREAAALVLPINPGPGEEVEAQVKTLLNQTPETIALLKRTVLQ